MMIQKYKFIQSDGEELWKKELKQILSRDIHGKSLGCCVNNTHMKIGDIHLGTFFEAQFLFGNAYWISIFSNALKQTIINDSNNCFMDRKSQPILLIGYETYSEPVILRAKELLQDNYLIDYCIYEEPKYTLHNQKSDVRIRLCSERKISQYQSFIIVSGISSTLSTYYQIVSQLRAEIKKETKECIKHEDIIKKCRFYSIIQVLPDCFEKEEKESYSFNDSSDTLEYDKENNTVKRKKFFIEAKFLVNAFCEWQNAKDCKWCYEQEYERAIVSTNETSVIPIQMIGSNRNNKLQEHKKKETQKIDFFKRGKNNEFFYTQYLYYNHIERSTHHYQYYVRTNALLKRITEVEDENEKLDKFCKDVRTQLIKDENEQRIDVIVVPTHYSNERFSSIVSQRIFLSRCEIISINPKKEYRSNFETKYSNYSYIFDAVKNNQTKIYFHYVDDQLITGNSFYRAKSFVQSLMKKAEKYNNNIRLFESVIVMLNRNSNSTKMNYIDSEEKYYSLIDIEVPFLRNYGDSCYLCAKIQTAKELKQNSAYLSMSDYWQGKEGYHRVKTLQEAKKSELNRNEEIKKRKFRHFYCENLLWKNLRNDWSDEKKIYQKLLKIISDNLKNNSIEDQYELMISFVKILSRPFLYYRENIKKAILSIMLYTIFLLNREKNIVPRSLLACLKKIQDPENRKATYSFLDSYPIRSGMISEKVDYCKKYYLYVILLSNLSAINSNYLINRENIKKAMEFSEDVAEKGGKTFDKQNPDMQTFICRNIKTVTNGISGNYKAKKLDKQLESDSTFRDKYPELFQQLYLENLEADDTTSKISLKQLLGKTDDKEKDDNHENDSETEQTLKDKYKKILDTITPKETARLVVLFQDEKSFCLAKSTAETSSQLEQCFLRFVQQMSKEDDIIKNESLFAVRCASQEHIHHSSDIRSVYYISTYLDQNQSDDSKEPQEKEFEEEIRKLKAIRSMLHYRYELSQMLYADINSGSVKDLFLDDKIMDTLSQPKSVSHGQSEDIKEHLNVLKQMYTLFAENISVSSKGEPSKELLNKYSIYPAITVFSNIIISNYHLNRISKEMGKKYKFSDQLKLERFRYSCGNFNDADTQQLIKKQDSLGGIVDEKLIEKTRVKSNCVKDFLCMVNYYIQCLNNKEEFKIIFDGTIIKQNMEQINSVINPFMINSSSLWFSVALIHMLVKNAYQHGETGGEITIKFEKEDEQYNLIVSNNKREGCDNYRQGITQKALLDAFQDSTSSIFFDADGKNSEKYTVKITNFLCEEEE